MHILQQYIKLLIETHSPTPTPTLAYPIGKGFCFPVGHHGQLSSMSIDPSQKQALIHQATSNGILYEGIGESNAPGQQGQHGKIEQSWIAQQLNIDPTDIKKIRSFDDLLLEKYQDKDHFAYATFANLNFLPKDPSFNPSNPKKYIHSILSNPTFTFQHYKFSHNEINTFIDTLSLSNPSILSPNRFKNNTDLANAIYYTIFDTQPMRQNCTTYNQLGTNTDTLLQARQDNLINLLESSGGIAFIGVDHIKDILDKTKPKTT